MDSGIYALYWWDQDLIYIGLSQNLRIRSNEHFRLMRGLKHTNYKIQNSYNLYGNPEFIVLEYCKIEELAEKEKFWAKEFNAVDDGLCLVEPGIVGFGPNSNNSKYSKLQILLVFRQLYLGKKLISVIASELKVNRNLVTDINIGKSHIWLRDKYPFLYNKMKLVDRIEIANSYKKSKCLRKTPSILVSENGTEVVVENIREFSRVYNLHSGHIGDVIRGTSKSCKGWRLKISAELV